MSEFKNKTVLITGASEGIGRATALAFAKKGADLILVARNLNRLESLAKEAKAFNSNIILHSIDLSNVDAVDSLFQGISTLDIAINNAGTEGRIAEINELSVSDYNAVFDINVRALFQCLKHEVSHFRSRNKPGVIVNISSIAGIRGISNSSLYVASKHAVIGFTAATAVEQIKYGIRINCLSPGSTDTPMLTRIMGDRMPDHIESQPTQRLAAPEEIASCITWLSGSGSRNVVGQNLIVDGGRTAHLA